ncbi:hypothetical protein DM02DRAFT_657257 [Periconia macrospinosa]|uniref:Uncharacterized protein n=1 Tax=Periconia macrospinosa TaxID=97972 RepID=A0A2V1DKF8_9PLEO|nr:hypothetical protein DM02DRAFT_657257 [Periconia macrospinosa]
MAPRNDINVKVHRKVAKKDGVKKRTDDGEGPPEATQRVFSRLANLSQNVVNVGNNVTINLWQDIKVLNDAKDALEDVERQVLESSDTVSQSLDDCDNAAERAEAITAQDCAQCASDLNGEPLSIGLKPWSKGTSYSMVVYNDKGQTRKKDDIDWKNSDDKVFGYKLERAGSWDEWEVSFREAWYEHHKIAPPTVSKSSQLHKLYRKAANAKALRTVNANTNTNSSSAQKTSRVSKTKTTNPPTTNPPLQTLAGHDAYVQLHAGEKVLTRDMPALAQFIKTTYNLRTAPPQELLEQVNVFVRSSDRSPLDHFRFTNFLKTERWRDEKARKRRIRAAWEERKKEYVKLGFISRIVI